MNPHPIALFGYNRPHHLKAALEFIDRSQKQLKTPCKLYIFCDGPKSEKASKAVEQTIAVAKSHPKAKVVVRERNLEFQNIVQGISELCDQYGSIIVIEDDILISPDFLPFMCQGLDRYKESEEVWAITGFNHFAPQPKGPQLFFSPYFFCWGWATYKRAWDQFKAKPLGWQTFLATKNNRKKFDCYGGLKHSSFLKRTMEGKLKAWAPQCSYQIFKHKKLVLTPNRSLVWNCGIGGGTHGLQSKDQTITDNDHDPTVHGTLSLEEFTRPRLQQPLTFPAQISSQKKEPYRLALNVKLAKISVLPSKYKRFRKKSKLLPLRLRYLLSAINDLF